MHTVDAVLRFLQSIGKSREAEFYLRLFRESKEQFATLVVDAELVDEAFDAVVVDLQYLTRLDLFPVVVFGLFDPQNAQDNAQRMVLRLADNEVSARVVAATADRAAIVEDLRAGTVVVVALSDGDGANEQARFERVADIVNALGSRKLIYLTPHGGLHKDGVTLSFANMTTQFEELYRSAEVSPRQRTILEQARQLLYGLAPHKVVVTITSPLDLLRELFTVKGVGTLLRKGAIVETVEDHRLLDRTRLRQLLLSSFGRPPVDGFFDRPVSRAFVEQDYRGAALLVDTWLGSYLTKFVVEREAQGEGIGRDLWDVLIAKTPVFFWRARTQNPVGPWYAKMCDGLSRHGEWDVFWKGLERAKIPDAIDFALAQPVDL